MPDRFHQLPELLYRAYQAEDLEKTEALSHEYLELAEQFQTNWNYGNALHQAHLYLGLIAVARHDIEKAKAHLLHSADTPGSPQLRSFGPNMLLAKKLLEQGEQEVVLRYMDKVKKFWHFLFRFFRIRKWKKAIKQGQIPNFKGSLIYHMRTDICEAVRGVCC